MRNGLLWLVLSVSLLAAAWGVSPRLASGLPGLAAVKLDAGHALEDLGLLSLGMRRQAADLHFIRLLQYYGTPEGEEPHEHAGHAPHRHGPEFGSGAYAEMYPRALRILELDPFFRYAAIYAAGALAFNLDRPEEAVALLRQALERDPKAWRYHLYIAAIAYGKEKEFGRLVTVLEPALVDPECPAMLKMIVAGLFQKLGRPAKALALYRDVESGSRDPEYREMASRRIQNLLNTPQP